MELEIDIVRIEGAYRLLHGHLRLATAMNLQKEVVVAVPGDGLVKIVRTRQGYFASKDGQHLPMLGG